MDYTGIRKLLLKVFIGFLAITAIIAITLVFGDDFGETQMKILATTFAISAASICLMSCAAFIEKRKFISLGLAGIFLSVAGATLFIVGMWSEINREEYWKATLALIVSAIAFAYAFLLVLPELGDRQRWVKGISSATIGILAVQVIVAVWGEIHDEIYYRFLIAVAIVVGLETLIVPILMKLRRENSKKREPLVLENVEGETYKDSAGKLYNVRKVDTERIAPVDS